MKLNQNDIAMAYCIKFGVTRKGEGFVEADTLENVLGDVPHKNCCGVIAMMCVNIMHEFLKDHFGHEITDEVPTEDDLVSFFDKARDISDD